MSSMGISGAKREARTNKGQTLDSSNFGHLGNSLGNNLGNNLSDNLHLPSQSQTSMMDTSGLLVVGQRIPCFTMSFENIFWVKFSVMSPFARGFHLGQETRMLVLDNGIFQTGKRPSLIFPTPLYGIQPYPGAPKSPKPVQGRRQMKNW